MASAVAIGAGIAWAAGVMPDDLLVIANTVTPGCSIKGNISTNTGERIFHVPGQPHYDETRISLQHGERWFCSEAEARSAGWRKARG